MNFATEMRPNSLHEVCQRRHPIMRYLQHQVCVGALMMLVLCVLALPCQLAQAQYQPSGSPAPNLQSPNLRPLQPGNNVANPGYNPAFPTSGTRTAAVPPVGGNPRVATNGGVTGTGSSIPSIDGAGAMNIPAGNGAAQMGGAGQGTAGGGENAATTAAWQWPSFVTQLLAGGWLMLPLVVCSLIVITLAMERALALRRGRVIPRPFVQRFTE
ncbi:MAG: hypothetical protein AAFP90_24270, partial [Planctomycetota bacterium]